MAAAGCPALSPAPAYSGLLNGWCSHCVKHEKNSSACNELEQAYPGTRDHKHPSSLPSRLPLLNCPVILTAVRVPRDGPFLILTCSKAEASGNKFPAPQRLPFCGERCFRRSNLQRWAPGSLERRVLCAIRPLPPLSSISTSGCPDFRWISVFPPSQKKVTSFLASRG